MADMVEIDDVDGVAGGATRPRHRSALPDSAVQRRADAKLILATVHAMADWESVSGRPIPAKPPRELVWTVWEQPRLPRPVHRGKYPLAVPWSPAARRANADPGARLVIDHVLPAAALARRLLDDPPGTPTALVRILNSITYLVIAPEDNQRLRAAGVGAKLAPNSSDPLDRYAHAGIDLSAFAPILSAREPNQEPDPSRR